MQIVRNLGTWFPDTFKEKSGHFLISRSLRLFVKVNHCIEEIGSKWKPISLNSFIKTPKNDSHSPLDLEIFSKSIVGMFFIAKNQFPDKNSHFASLKLFAIFGLKVGLKKMFSRYIVFRKFISLLYETFILVTGSL